MSVSRVLFLVFETSGVAYSIHVNGIKLAADRSEPQSSNAFPINQWLQPGTNRLAVNLSVPYEQEDYKEGKSALVRILEPGEGESPETVFASLAWNDAQGEDFPIDMALDFEVEAGFPIPAWMGADALGEAEAADASLRHFLARLHADLRSRDLPAFQSGFAVKTSEMAAAYGMDPADRLNGQREFMGRLFGDPRWDLEPLPNELAFEFQADRRMLTVTKKTGKPVLQSVELDDGVLFGIDLHLSRKAGAWFVCR
ncbi:MAG: hypothetical protein ABI036_00820 [Fibrobacteria bacterium]